MVEVEEDKLGKVPQRKSRTKACDNKLYFSGDGYFYLSCRTSKTWRYVFCLFLSL